MKNYKINIIYSDINNIDDIFIKVLEKEIQKSDELKNSSFFCR